jgi:hypothetical protein
MSAELQKLIQPSEILDMAKRHDRLPDAKGITLENENILSFTDALLGLLACRLADIEYGLKTQEHIENGYKCRCGTCAECNWARTHE